MHFACRCCPFNCFQNSAFRQKLSFKISTINLYVSQWVIRKLFTRKGNNIFLKLKGFKLKNLTESFWQNQFCNFGFGKAQKYSKIRVCCICKKSIPSIYAILAQHNESGCFSWFSKNCIWGKNSILNLLTKMHSTHQIARFF